MNVYKKGVKMAESGVAFGMVMRGSMAFRVGIVGFKV